MMTFVIIIHAMACAFLAIIILMQSGRGGGLTEQFASAENVFGAKTNVVMVRITSVLATIFIITSCTLAVLSARKEESLMRRLKAAVPAANKTIEIPIQKDIEKTAQQIDKGISQQPVQALTEAPKEVVTPVSSQPATAIPEPAK